MGVELEPRATRRIELDKESIGGLALDHIAEFIRPSNLCGAGCEVNDTDALDGGLQIAQGSKNEDLHRCRSAREGCIKCRWQAHFAGGLSHLSHLGRLRTFSGVL